MQRGINVRLAPFHDCAQFLPIGDLLKRQLFHRCAGDDHAVVAAVFDLVKGLVELYQVLRRGVCRLIAGRIQEVDLDLQRRIAQQPEKLGFGNDLGWHQIEQQ